MPTPIGHSLAGAIIYAVSTKGKNLLKSWRWLVSCVAFAALADIDFLPGLFGRLELANRLHRHLTHTLLFAIAVSGIAFGVLRILKRPRPVRGCFILFCCMGSHILLDLLGKDFRPPIGVPFLSPFTAKSFKIPVGFFLDLHKDTYAEIFSLRTAGILVHEVLLFGGILVIIAALKLRRAARELSAEEHEDVMSGTLERTV